MLWCLLVACLAAVNAGIISPKPVANAELSSIAFDVGAATYCAVTTKGETMHSADAKTWTMNGALPGMSAKDAELGEWNAIDTFDFINPFVVYSKSNTKDIWTSGDCKTFKKSPFNGGTLTGSWAGIAGGQGIILAINKDYHHGFVCGTDGSNCNTGEIQVYGQTQVTFDSPRNSFVVWNETHGVTLGSCTPKRLCANIVPFNLPPNDNQLTLPDFAFINTTLFCLQVEASSSDKEATSAQLKMYSTSDMYNWKVAMEFSVPTHTSFRVIQGHKPDAIVLALDDTTQGTTTTYWWVEPEHKIKKPLTITGHTKPIINSVITNMMGEFIGAGANPTVSGGKTATWTTYTN